MLVGTYEGRIDAQGRVVIPQKCRDPLEGGMFLVRGLDGNVDVYPPAEFSEVTANVQRFSSYNRDARLAQRLIFSSAFKATMDRQGRVVLPPGLRKHAGIEDEIVITGVNSKLEIWSKDRWQEQEAESVHLAEIAGKLEALEENA